MNNKAEKFHYENKKMILQLIESLDAILEKFASGITPGGPEKSGALYMLDVYLKFLKKYEDGKLPVFRRFREFKKIEFDEKTSAKELSNLKESIFILIKLGREKIIPSEDEAFTYDAGKTLVNGGYCEEIITGESKTRFYILSEKGEKAIKSKKLLTKLQDDVVSAIVPSEMIYEAAKWSSLYVKRVELINAYYQKYRDSAEHILFSLDDSKEMVFGCEVCDTVGVNYVFAGVFDERIDDHITQLKGLAGSGLIDKIVIVLNSDNRKTLLLDEGLDSEKLPQIIYTII